MRDPFRYYHLVPGGGGGGAFGYLGGAYVRYQNLKKYP